MRLVALIALLAIGCTQAEARRRHRTRNVAATASSCINPLTGGLAWDVRFEGKDATGTSWVDAEGNAADLPQVDETGDISLGNATTGLTFCDSAYDNTYVTPTGGVAYYNKVNNTTYPTFADGTNIRLRAVFRWDSIAANDTAYVVTSGGNDYLWLYATSATNMRMTFAGDGAENQCNFTVATATDYFLDVLYTDNGTNSATIQIYLNGTALSACNTTGGTAGFVFGTGGWHSIFSSTVNNEADGLRLLYLSVGADTGEMNETIHDRDCLAIGICS